jgi:glycerophosphoryl diester phosphodiesterase
MWVIAHRGASAVAPENTLAAFRRAVEMGAGFIELDLQLSRDAHLVVLHDDTLGRTTTGRGPVSGKTLEELRRLDAGAWFDGTGKGAGAAPFAGERIPTVEEALAFGRAQDIGLYLELKATGPNGAEHVLAGALRSAGETGRSVVLSFSANALAQIRRLEPLLVTGYLYSEAVPNPVERAEEVGARQLLPRSDRITSALVAEAHRSDLKVVAWTVDAAEKMSALRDAGVDGIITNRPDVLVELLSTAG